MKIMFIPQRRDESLSLSVLGDEVTVNGVAYDLSVVPEGASLPASATDCEHFFGDISRANGELSIGVVLPHCSNPHRAIAFPDPISAAAGVVVDTTNGIYPWSMV